MAFSEFWSRGARVTTGWTDDKFPWSVCTFASHHVTQLTHTALHLIDTLMLSVTVKVPHSELNYNWRTGPPKMAFSRPRPSRTQLAGK